MDSEMTPLRNNSSMEALFEHTLPATDKNLHQIVRTFRHLHCRPVRLIIAAYMDIYSNSSHYGNTQKQEYARQTLSAAISDEVNNFLFHSDTWDRPIWKFLNECDDAKACLHNGLLKMKDDVWALEWCGDWKNCNMFWLYDKGPGRLLVNSVKKQDGKFDTLPIYLTCEKDMVHMKNMRDNSIYLLTSHDLARIIKCAWKGNLPSIFKYEIPDKVQNYLSITPQEKQSLKEELTQFERQWKVEDALYQENNQDTAYKFNRDLSQNPYLCKIGHILSLGVNFHGEKPTGSSDVSSDTANRQRRAYFHEEDSDRRNGRSSKYGEEGYKRHDNMGVQDDDSRRMRKAEKEAKGGDEGAMRKSGRSAEERGRKKKK